jgi:hypothetical protein
MKKASVFFVFAIVAIIALLGFLSYLKITGNATAPVLKSERTVKINGNMVDVEIKLNTNQKILAVKEILSKGIVIQNFSLYSGVLCEGDSDKSGEVNSADYFYVDYAFGRLDCEEENNWCDGGDINQDGRVDGKDTNFIDLQLGKSGCKRFFDVFEYKPSEGTWIIADKNNEVNDVILKYSFVRSKPGKISGSIAYFSNGNLVAKPIIGQSAF